MAEPLSLAASIVAVIQLSSEVVSYIATARGAPKEWRRLRDEIFSCQSVLEHIDDNSRCAEDSDDDEVGEDWGDKVRVIEAFDGPLPRIYKALHFIKEKINPGSGLQRAVAVMKWPFDAKEVKEMIEVIEREKSLLNLALSIKCRRLVKELSKNSKERQAKLEDLLRTLEGSTSKVLATVEKQSIEISAGIAELKGHHETRDRQAVLSWLSSDTYAAQQTDFIRRRESGTGEWLLQSPEYLAWLSATDGQTLFCPGMPGAGKTMLSAIVVDELTKKSAAHHDIAVAHVFCNFRRKKEETAENIIMSLLKQLAQQRPTLPATVHQLYKRHCDRGTRPSLQEASDALHCVTGAYTKVFYVNDALDEAERTRFMSIIFSVQKSHKSNIFATSRFIPDIVNQFAGLPSLEIRASTQDVEMYLEGQMQELEVYQDWNTVLREEVKSVISKAVDGMFLLAILYLRVLDDKSRAKDVRSTLTAFRRQSAGSSEVERREVLSNAYDQAMQRITSQRPGFAELGLKALSWITFAKRQLMPQELQLALAVDMRRDDEELDETDLHSVERIISVCAGLVALDAETQDIRLVHYTTQDYFQASWQNWFPDAHNNLTRSLVTYLSDDNIEFNWYQGKGPRAYLSSQLYDYALNYWGHHARKSTCMRVEILAFLTSNRFLSAPSPRVGVRLRSVSGLHLAAWYGLLEIMGDLMVSQDVDVRDSEMRTPLFYAAYMSKLGSTYLPLGSVSWFGGYTSDESADTALDTSAHRRASAAINLLLDRGAEIDARDVHNRTALHLAVTQSGGTAAILLARGTDVNLKDKGGFTAMHRDITVTSALCLLRNGADIEARNDNYRTPLHEAAMSWRDDIPLFKLLLDQGSNLETRDILGHTPLHTVVHLPKSDRIWWDRPPRFRHGQFVYTKAQLLLERGADVNATDILGKAPLHIAIEECEDLATIQLFLDHGALVDTKNERGWTPLHSAVALEADEHGEHLSILQALLDHGADVEAKDIRGCTPLHIAPAVGLFGFPDDYDEYGYPLGRMTRGVALEGKELLLDRGADLQAVALDGRTPLFTALALVLCDKIYMDYLKLLLKRGAKVGVVDATGLSPLGLAAHASNPSLSDKLDSATVEFLLRHGLHGTDSQCRGAYPYGSPAKAMMGDARGACACLDTAYYLLPRVRSRDSCLFEFFQEIPLQGWLNAVRILVTGGADAEHAPGCDDHSFMAFLCRGLLRLARRKATSRSDLTNLILKTGADVDDRYYSEEVVTQYLHLVRLLLERGVSLDPKIYEESPDPFKFALNAYALGSTSMIELFTEFTDFSTRRLRAKEWLSQPRPVRERRASF